MQYKRIGDIAELINGYAFKSKNYVEQGIRVIRIANVQDGKIVDEQPCFYPEKNGEDIEKYILKKGDLLISLTGNVGRVGLLSESMLPAALNQRVGCIRLKDANVDMKYLFFCLRRKEFIRDCIKASKGVAQLNLSTKWIEDYKVPIPELLEQRCIVSKIEELFSSLDNSVETLNKTKEQLEVYRQAVLKNAFDNLEGELLRVKDICNEIKVGIVIKPSQYYTTAEKGIKAFRSANVREFHIDDFDWVYLNDKGQEENKRSIVHTGDVLIVRSGYPGTACVVEEKYDGSNAIDVLIAVPNQNIVLPEYLCAYTNSPLGKVYVSEKKRGVGQKHFNVGGYSAMNITVPSKEVQYRIVSEIADKLSFCDNIMHTIIKSLQQAEAMRQSILKEAFEGRLV